MRTTIPLINNHEQRRAIVGNEPMVFHCHHFNTYLQQVIRDAEYVESAPFLIGAAEEVSFAQLSRVYKEENITDPAERKALAQEIFKWAGFGTIDLAPFSADGGTCSSDSEHYSATWKSKFGISQEPVGYFASGWLAGAVEAIHDLPQGSFSVTQSACRSMDPEGTSTFNLKKGPANFDVFQAVGIGTLSEHRMRHIPENNVDYNGIYEAVSAMSLVGNEDGLIPVFGVYLTRHFANYYNRIVFEQERRAVELLGEEFKAIAEPMFVESGHVCAFNTFGGIMESAEWNALIKPSLKNRKDWVHGIVAVINTLGWGRWQVVKVSEDEAEFVIQDDYESVGYRAMYGKADHNVSYLGKGGCVGIMNLVYYGDIHTAPKLDQDFYNKLFRSEGGYQAETLSSLAMGDSETRFRVWKK